MRLWHYELIPYLPDSQLLAQWRELNSIYKKQDKHILINYIYSYPKSDLYTYSFIILKEFVKRNFKVSQKSFFNFIDYFYPAFDDTIIEGSAASIPCGFVDRPFTSHHTDKYLVQCFYNLQEKYDRGQKDFSVDRYHQLEDFIKGRVKDALLF